MPSELIQQVTNRTPKRHAHIRRGNAVSNANSRITRNQLYKCDKRGHWQHWKWEKSQDKFLRAVNKETRQVHWTDCTIENRSDTTFRVIQELKHVWQVRRHSNRRHQRKNSSSWGFIFRGLRLWKYCCCSWDQLIRVRVQAKRRCHFLSHNSDFFSPQLRDIRLQVIKSELLDIDYDFITSNWEIYS